MIKSRNTCPVPGITASRFSWSILLVLFLLSSPVFAQDFFVRQFTVSDGLPASGIQSLFKDSKGLLWIGTNAALCTYDGKQFTTILTPEGKTLDQVWSITEDPHGNMWFGSHSEGIYRYDGKDFTHFTTHNGLSDNTIRYIYYSKKYDLLAACAFKGVNIIRNDTVQISPAWLEGINTNVNVTGIAEGPNYLMFSTIANIGPVRYYPEHNRFVSLKGYVAGYPDASISVNVTSAGDTIVGRYVTGVWIHKRDGIVQDSTIGQVFSVSEDRDGNVWMASWSHSNRDLKEGIYRWDGKKFVNFKSKFGITDKEIWSVCCDRDQDIVWVGTINDGLYQAVKTDIKTYRAEDLHLKNLYINNLFVDSGNHLWISDRHELIRMDPGESFSWMDKHQMTSRFREYWRIPKRYVMSPIDSTHKALQTLPTGQLPGFEQKTPFEFKWITETPDHTIFFSNRFGIFALKGNLVDYFGPEGSEGSFEFISRDTLVFTGTGASSYHPVFLDKSANLKKRFKSGVLKYDYSSILYFSWNGEPLSVTRQRFHQNRMWYASFVSGLWITEGDRITHLNTPDSSISNNLNDLCFDREGHLIYGSNTGEIGIASWDGRRLELLYRIDASSGLKGSSINWLLADSAGYLWAGTNLGLNCIDLNKLFQGAGYGIRFIDQEDGYFGQGSKRAVMNREGSLFISAQTELIRIDTRSFLSKPLRPKPLIINSFLANQKPMGPGAILRPYQKNLVFRFDVLNYINPKEDRFRYMLEGYDKEWSQWDVARMANYTNLSNGKYHFKVESLNQGDSKERESLDVEFTILSPIWKLWIVQVTVAILLIILIVFFTQKIVNQKRMKEVRKAETERRILQLEMQALQAQMNPHFIYNCLSGIQYSILEQKTDEAMDYLNDFSKVIRISMENSTGGFIIFDREIEFLNSYLRLEQMRVPGKFEFTIINHNVPTGNIIRIPSMILQPLAENAIKHGFSNIDQTGRLTIEFSIESKNMLKCTIIDNGKGRIVQEKTKTHGIEPSRLHSTTITEMRIQGYNRSNGKNDYRIEYTDLTHDPGRTGLKVDLYLPVNHRFH